MTTTSFARNLLTILAMCIALFPGRLSAQDQGPTVEEYMAYVGASATLVPAGKLKIDGQRVKHGRPPTAAHPLAVNLQLTGRHESRARPDVGHVLFDRR
ncbi:MAG: hypothetical protein AAFO79_08385, partial [Pseudomonadota bacterium]